MMPSGFSCCSSGGGMWSMPQVTMILSNGRGLFPAVIAVGVLGGDRLVLGVAALDQRVVDAARALGERLDDLDRPDLVGEVGEIGRLVAGAGADLEHLLAELDVDGRWSCGRPDAGRRWSRRSRCRGRRGRRRAPRFCWSTNSSRGVIRKARLLRSSQQVPVVRPAPGSGRQRWPRNFGSSPRFATIQSMIGLAACPGRRRDVPAVGLGNVGPCEAGHCCAGQGTAGQGAARSEQKGPSLHVCLQSLYHPRSSRQTMTGTRFSQAISVPCAIVPGEISRRPGREISPEIVNRARLTVRSRS